MESAGEHLRPSTPPLPASAFAASAQQPWDAAPSPPSRSGAGSPGTGSRAASGGLPLPQADAPRLNKSLSASRQSSANPFAQAKPAELWRASTAVCERAASQGLSFEALCGDSYIPAESLRKPKPLGEGAFAVVETAQLVPPASGGAGTWPAGGSPRAQPRTVAVKRLKPNVIESEDDVLCFIQEARLLVNLQHPSVIEFIGLGAADHSCPEAEWRTMYLVQEYACCGTLKKLLLSQMINPTKKLFSLQDAVRWAHQIAEGLAYLHQLNPMILHRDLKAENVLLTRGTDGRIHAKLADFGLHKLIRRPGKAQWSFCHIREEDSQAGTAPPSPSVSQHGMGSQHSEPGLHVTADSSFGQLGKPEQAAWQHGALLKLGLAPPSGLARGQAGLDAIKEGRKWDMTGQTGALTYMAPEVLLGSRYNEKVDVFSFGMVLFELLHRKMVVADLMYLGSTGEAEAFAYKVAAGYRMPIDQQLPESLRQLITDCLAGCSDLRPSMAEVVQRLHEVRESGQLEEHEHRHGPASAAGCCTVM